MRTAALIPAAAVAATYAFLGAGATAAPGGRRVALPASAADQALKKLSFPVPAIPFDWPLRPFDRQHAIRGGFGDPRFGAVQRNFHFGIDIPAAGGTPVYAVAPGTVFLEPDHVDVLTRADSARPSGFSYWHIVAAVPEHAYARRHTLLGWVKRYWSHLHFSELLDGRWLNPLRSGALSPYHDPRKPTIQSVEVTSVQTGSRSERVDVVVDASAPPPTPPPPPWQDARLAPSLIRWRLLSNGEPISTWRTAVDFRTFIPPNAIFNRVYAPGTFPNAPTRPGDYRFYLARDWNIDSLPAGRDAIEVQVFGSRGGPATAYRFLHVRRPSPRLP
jgi:hypothetical protein